MPGFPKSARLLAPKEFAAVRGGGVRIRTGHMMLSLLKVPGRKRLGLVVGRHVGTAPQRNKIKRIIREFFRLNREQFPEGDCVVIPYKGAADLTNNDIRLELTEALKTLEQK